MVKRPENTEAMSFVTFSNSMDVLFPVVEVSPLYNNHETTFIL